VDVGLYLRSGGTDTQISSWDTPTHTVPFSLLVNLIDVWFFGLNPGESLVAKLVNGTMPTDGSQCQVGAIWQTA
jgi:hypothetical protein